MATHLYINLRMSLLLQLKICFIKHINSFNKKPHSFQNVIHTHLIIYHYLMTEKYSSTIVTLFFSMHALHCVYLLRLENIIAIISVNSIEHNQSVPTTYLITTVPKWKHKKTVSAAQIAVVIKQQRPIEHN